VGETLRCYVKSVSPQSGRFSLTLNPEPTSLRDEKQIAVINKRVEKLEKSGDLAKIQDARGSIQKGSVIALSKTDVHQFYVKIPGLPVGVATSSSDALDVKVRSDEERRTEGWSEEAASAMSNIFLSRFARDLLARRFAPRRRGTR
jgi:hypothetical protein